MFTGVDNKTYDIARVGFFLSLVTFLALSEYSTVKTGVFEYEKFGIGLGAMAAAFGGMIWAKKDTEPKGEPCGNP